MVRRSLALLTLVLLATSCGNVLQRETDADRLTPPTIGACRDLTVDDLDQPSNADPVVDCARDHTAQTFAIGTLPDDTGSAYRDERHGKFVFETCSRGFREFLGADESLAMRTQLGWAWFRPSQRGWDRGARWYRCDLVGGPTGAKRLRDLPEQAKGLFSADRPDAWLTCARGETVAESEKVPCSEDHDWRAVTTIKVGQPDEEYPGDRIVQVRSRDRCSDWVGSWLHYPPDYDYGYSWFREAEWSTGNRRSICWARTDQ